MASCRPTQRGGCGPSWQGASYAKPPPGGGMAGARRVRAAPRPMRTLSAASGSARGGTRSAER
eukprot:11188105-Lingulodinium_polyedra.AAC.1